jgi:hypothetical protein
LIGIVVAYAVAAQSLLIALGGFAPAASAESAPGFELCLHDAAAAPALPAGAPAHTPCSHCIFCFSGANHVVIGSPPALVHGVYFAITAASWTADKQRLPHLSAHSIASPRGPPPQA